MQGFCPLKINFLVDSIKYFFLWHRCAGLLTVSLLAKVEWILTALWGYLLCSSLRSVFLRLQSPCTCIQQCNLWPGLRWAKTPERLRSTKITKWIEPSATTTKKKYHSTKLNSGSAVCVIKLNRQFRIIYRCLHCHQFKIDVDQIQDRITQCAILL